MLVINLHEKPYDFFIEILNLWTNLKLCVYMPSVMCNKSFFRLSQVVNFPSSSGFSGSAGTQSLLPQCCSLKGFSLLVSPSFRCVQKELNLTPCHTQQCFLKSFPLPLLSHNISLFFFLFDPSQSKVAMLAVFQVITIGLYRYHLYLD